MRSYLPENHPDKAKEIGSEATPADYLDTLLALTAEWRRLLAPHGSIAIELGDTYSGSGGAGGDYNPGGLRDGQNNYTGTALRRRTDTKQQRVDGGAHPIPTLPGGYAGGGSGWPLEKSLTGIPTLYAWSLAYGRNLLTGQPSPAGQWRIRNLKPWIRSNPPVGALGDKERPATSYITVACVGRERWFDLDAVRTPHATADALTRPRTAGGREQARVDVGLSSGNGESGSNPGGAPPLDWWHPIDALIDDELNQRAGKGANRRTAKGIDQTDRTGKSADRGGNWGSLPELGETNGSVGARGMHIRRRLEAAGYLTPQDFHDISPKGYAGAHYAVWPPELVRQLINEMCPRRVCVECGVPSRRITEIEYIRSGDSRRSDDSRRYGSIDGKRHNVGAITRHKMVGWSDCGCPPHGGSMLDTCKNCGEPIRWSLDFRRWLHEQPRVRYCPRNFTPDGNPTTEAEPNSPSTDHWRPGRILDPFVGSGTTLAVASGMGRDSVGIDLDERNADLCRERVGLFLEVDYGEREVPA